MAAKQIFFSNFSSEKYRPSDPPPLADHGDGGYPPHMDIRIGKIETRLDSMDKRLDSMDNRMGRLETKVSNLRWWVLGSVITMAAIVVAFGAYQATWFQHSLDRNWEQSQKALDKIDATMLKVERMDAERQPKQ